MLKRTPKPIDLTGPVGLDDRPRPASSRERIIKGLKQSAPFSSLQRRIIFFNLVGLALLVAGVSLLSNDRDSIRMVYVDALRKQGEVIAITIAETAGLDQTDRPTLDPVRSAQVLARLALPTGVRIRLYDHGQRLTADTYNLTPQGPPIEVTPLGPPRTQPPSALTKWFERLYANVDFSLGDPVDVYYEVPVAGISRDVEVRRAAMGEVYNVVRVNSQGEAVVSVAMPVTRLKAIMGVLHLSTMGGEVERLLAAERRAILEVFFLAAMVSVLLSIVLANKIASPIRMLARAAQAEGSGGGRAISLARPEIPDLTNRSDEIGELSGALIRMTGALYQRIGTIESFAADVAHEIKNPLTSLRSAVETMKYAKTDQQRQRLLDVIVNDVTRLDRLVTDISNASRLDAELVRERMQPLDMGELIRMLADVTRAQGAERHVRVATDLPQGVFMAEGLEGRLAQVFTNLLGNALSFSPDDATITITGRVIPDMGIRVSVEDQGPGIPPENLDSIFQRFYSQRPETEVFGTHSGLGLSISKQIVEAHGGAIWAENIADPNDFDGAPRGARFVVELPD